MKKFYLFMVLMLAAVTSAFAQEPTFTAEGAADDAATWYYIQFQREAKLVLSTYEGGNGKNVRPTYASKEEPYKNQQLFKLVGAADGFAIVSKDGYHFTFDGAVKMSNEGDAPKIFTLLQKGVGEFTGSDVFQIQVKGRDQGQSFNPSGGPYVGKNIALWSTDDPSNPLKFRSEADVEVTEKVTPEFVTAFDKDAAQWYQIMFITNTTYNGPVFQEAGEGAEVEQQNPISDKENADINKQLWQFVGDENGFQLVNKNGMYAYYEGKLKTSATPKDYKFTFNAMNLPQFSGLPTQIMIPNGQGLNAFGGVKAGAKVGAWTNQNDNNSLLFVPVTMPVPKEKIDKLMINFETEGEVADAPLTIALEGATDGASIMNTGSVSVLKNVYTGTEYTITATAKDGFEVKGFTVDGQFTEGTTLKLTVKKGMSIKVKYAKAEMVELTLAQIQDGGRLRFPDQSGDYTQSFAKGTEVTLVADTKDGYKLTKVLVDGQNIYTEGQPITVTADAPKTITPEYELTTPVATTAPFKIYFSKVEAKSFVLKDAQGTAITLPAKQTDAAGDTFYQLDLNIGATYSFEVTAPEGHTLKDVDTNFAGILQGTEFTLPQPEAGATEPAHLVFNWNVGKYPVVFQDAKGNELEWGEKNVMTVEGGSFRFKGYISKSRKIANFGKKFPILDVTPEEGYELESLTWNGQDISESLEFTVGIENVIAIKFRQIAPKEELFSVTETTEGAVYTDLEGLTDGKIAKDGVVTLKVTPQDMPMEVTIKVNGVERQAPIMVEASKPLTKELTITEDTNIEVVAEMGVSITFTAADSPNGTVEFEGTARLNDLITCARGSEVTVKATPDAGYVLKKIEVKGSDESDFRDITADPKFTVSPTEIEYEVRVEFAKAVESCQLSAVYSGDMGDQARVVFEGAKDDKTVDKGSKVTVKVTVEDGVFIKSIKINGEAVSEDVLITESYEKELTINEDTKVEVEAFVPGAIILTKKGEGDVKLTNTKLAKGNYWAEIGTQVAIEATPADGFVLKSIKVGGTDFTADPTLTVSNMQFAEVVFEKAPEKKAITIPAVENGTLTLDGVNSGDEVAVGTEVAITATPEKGYELESITVGGKDVTEAKKFTVGDDNTIVVKFRKITAIEGVDGVSVQVYPNPAADYVQLRGFAPNAEVRLIALTGKTVLSTKTNFSGSATLNVSDLSRGLYLVRSGNIVVKLQVR